MTIYGRKGRCETVIRVLSVMRELLHGRRTATQLARVFGVHRRTILRDIDVLSSAHVPVVQDGREYWIGR